MLRLGGAKVLLVALPVAALISGSAHAAPAASRAAPTSTSTPAGTTVFDHPFTATAPANAPIEAGAQYRSASDPRTVALDRYTTDLNSAKWSYAYYRATTADPTVQVRDPRTGAVRATVRIPSTAVPPGGTDGHVAVLQPDGRTAWEFTKAVRTADGWTATAAVSNDLTGDGVQHGARASDTSQFWGVIRQADLDRGVIDHTLDLGLKSSQLRSGPVWPALKQDSDAATDYTGAVPMGTRFAIPATVDVTRLGLSATGLELARALQTYGAYVLERSGSVSLYAETGADPATVKSLKSAWAVLRPLLVPVDRAAG